MQEPKYKIGDIVIVKNYQETDEKRYKQEKIRAAQYLIGRWLYWGKRLEAYGESEIIKKI